MLYWSRDGERELHIECMGLSILSSLEIKQKEAVNGKISLRVGAACAVSVHLGFIITSRHPYEQALLLASSFVAFASVIFLRQRLPDLLRPAQVITGMIHAFCVQ